MQTTHSQSTFGRTIFVVEANHVFLAESATRIGDEYHLVNASVIRVWGTTRGLGQIALEGPTKDTKLDPCGNPEIPADKVLFRLPCVY